MVTRSIIRAGMDALAKGGTALALQGIRQYNQLVLKGDIDRARRLILVEFNKNRELATMIYRKYKDQMDPEVQKIYEEMIQEDQDVTR
jgi:hypothetical protein